jgi:hypothetical protein
MINSLFISLTSPAILEHLRFNIRFHVDEDLNCVYFYNKLSNTDTWTHLDSLATHPTVSRLQRVDIKIQFSYQDDDGEDDRCVVIEEAILGSLPLLRTKGILFVKTEEVPRWQEPQWTS